MTTSDILKAALAKFGDGSGWTQGTCARNAGGESTYSVDPRAVSWCSLGAINAVGDGFVVPAYDALESVVPGLDIPIFNDAPGRAFPEVRAAFARAIALAEESERAA